MIRMLWETLRLALREEDRPGVAPKSRLWHCLQLSNHPTIGARRHQYYVVHDDVLVMNDFSAIGNPQLILCGIVQFHDVALWRVKHRFQSVALVHILPAEAGVLLADNRLPEQLLRRSCERPL